MILVDIIREAIAFVKRVFRRIIDGILNFFKHVVDWFKKLKLNPKKDIPFVADKEAFKNSLKSAPVKDYGLFQGVFDEQADEITHFECVEADAVDEETRRCLGNEDLVVLS